MSPEGDGPEERDGPEENDRPPEKREGRKPQSRARRIYEGLKNVAIVGAAAEGTVQAVETIVHVIRHLTGRLFRRR